MRSSLALTLVVALTLAAPAALAAAGYSTQIYDGPGWVRYGMSTYSLNLSSTPQGTGVQNPNLVYNPTNAWDPNSGHAWLQSTYTDSAAAATAMATGVKTYNNAINWSDFNTTIFPTIVESMHMAGKATGTITSVEFSHATPAGFSNAHNASRNNYTAIANQMLDGGYLDVIMGCGNPDYNNNGAYTPGAQNPQYVGGWDTWNALKAGTHSSGWQLVEAKTDFEALTTGNPTGRFLGCPQVYTTLQQARAANGLGGGYGNPSGDAFISTVPTLETMAKGALNILDANPNGFFLHIEGGAIDWANHATDLPRMIEEQMDFNRTVEAVMNWVAANDPAMAETLVLITADHECGDLWGPNSSSDPFDAIVDNGSGQVPDHHYCSGSHTNALVPLYAKGAGADMFMSLVDGNDPTAAADFLYANGWNGDYVDNTDLHAVMSACGAKNIILLISDGAGHNAFDACSMYEGRWVPEPASLVLVALGLLITRRR